MLALNVTKGSQVYLVTRSGDVVRLGFDRSDAAGLKLGVEGTRKVRVWRGELKRAPTRAESLEERLAEHLGVQAGDVELLAVDFREREYEVELRGESVFVSFEEAFPCPKTGEECGHECFLGSCYLERRGGRGL